MGKVITREQLRSFLPAITPTDEETAEKLTLISDSCFEFLIVILENCPDNDDRDQAFQAAKLARMWANSSLLAGPFPLSDGISTRPVTPS